MNKKNITRARIAFIVRKALYQDARYAIPLAAGAYYAAWAYRIGDSAGLFTGFSSTFLTLLSVAALAGSGAAAAWTSLWSRLFPFLQNHSIGQDSIRRGYRMPEKPVFDEPGVVFGESHPVVEFSKDGETKLTHTTADAFSITPAWASLPAPGLVTGLLVLGATGSGKTVYVMRPSVFKLFHHSTKPGGLVMDSKAALVEPLAQELAACGRITDLVAVGPDSDATWNPLHAPLSSPDTIAEQLLTAIENLNGAQFAADSRWIRVGAAHLATGAIGLVRMRAGYVTALTLRTFLLSVVEATAGSDHAAADARAFIESYFTGSTAALDAPDYYSHYADLVASRMGEDEKFRSIYCAELQQLLVPLTSPAVVKKYNAQQEDLSMPGWAEAIDRGLVVVLDCNSKAVPGLAVILGMLLKLGYEDAMISRLSWAKKGLCTMTRYMVLAIDEFQEFVSPGDTDYLALCRESRSISVFLTQGIASIAQRIGEDRLKVLLQSMRNRLVLTQTVPEPAAELLGQRDFLELDRSVNEQSSGAALSVTGRFSGETSVSESLSLKRQRRFAVPPEELAALPTGHGILQGFDGKRVLPLQRVYLLPHFAPDSRAADL